MKCGERMGSTVSVATQSTTSGKSPLQPSNLDDMTKQSDNDESERTNTGKKKRRPPPHLSGVKLVEYKCRKKKKAWKNCVGGWYDTRFLSGEALEEEKADCDALFERFRECYMRNMLKEREKQGLGPPKGDTMLAEFMDEEGIEPGK